MTAVLPESPPAPVRQRVPYENWRPPVVGVGVLVPVGADRLVLVRTCGLLSIPTGAVEDAQDVEDAARAVLTGLPSGLPIQRQAAVQYVQTRRRQVITHTVVTRPLLAEEAARLVYRDRRAEVCVLPTTAAAAALTERGRARVLLSLQALAIGATAFVHDNQVRLTPERTAQR
ncbi:hypothetical protein ACFFSH_39540 [Streptomyces filamentosus]|uniref:NUDIX hydrolase n=1 Tax=Streptomyces filamentosus TaxID=67294 RepID=A0A919EN30_STRFL|nr:hypothetical protein [Streptomyces filamentosus]GHG05575.1 hypothetical protein GCM10017667_40540 [Streptomyces filamentosus]